jgi:hypothetical protein
MDLNEATQKAIETLTKLLGDDSVGVQLEASRELLKFAAIRGQQ